MATISSTWTEAESLSFTNASPAKDVVAVAELDIANGGYAGVMIQLTLAFAAGIDGNATIYITNSSNSGTTDDSVETPLFSQEVTYAAAASRIISFQIMNTPYIQVHIKNGTSTEAELTLTGIYAGLKYTSA